MSGETMKNESGWTVDTLHDHVDQRFEDQQLRLNERHNAQEKALAAALAAAEKAVQAALAGAEKAVTKAEMATDKRFDGVNEFRQTLSDQASLFMLRTESEGAQRRFSDRISDLADRVTRNEGEKAGVRMTAGMLTGLIGASAAVVVLVNVFIALAQR